jgi:hypothetical protein
MEELCGFSLYKMDEEYEELKKQGKVIDMIEWYADTFKEVNDLKK